MVTNQLNCLGYGDVLLAQTIYITSSIEVVSNGNTLSSRPGFYGRSTEYPQIPLYNPGLNLLLGLNYKIITTG